MNPMLWRIPFTSHFTAPNFTNLSIGMVYGIGFTTFMIWLINGWNWVASQFTRAATESPCHEPLSLQHPSFKWNQMIMSERSKKANTKTYLNSSVETFKKTEHVPVLTQAEHFLVTHAACAVALQFAMVWARAERGIKQGSNTTLHGFMCWCPMRSSSFL